MMHGGYQRKRRQAVAEINVVPYIDVMLVLLIIFMATVPIITQGVKVDLPQTTEAESLEEDSKPPLVASVDVDGNYYLDVGDNGEQVLADDELVSLVQAHMQVDPTVPVVVKGDGAVAYEQVVRLMVLLQQAGVPSVGLMTQPQEQ